MFIPSIKPIVLVTGSNGQLGREFRYWASSQEQYEFLFTSRDTMDITELSEVLTIFSKWKPNYCINCAAYTAVDKAEEESKIAYKINRDAVQNLIIACTNEQCTLINFSTDYVYDSIVDSPITETAPTQPRSIYGKSKRAGEALLEASEIQWLNIRVSWLYSSFQNNFVKTMLRLGKTKSNLSIVSDQQGSPTYARDLAEDTMKIIEAISKKENSELSAHYNYSNTGITNWADFARLIFKLSRLQCNVTDTSTEDYGSPAPRPLWSVMDKSKIQSTFELDIPTIETSLSKCIDAIESL